MLRLSLHGRTTTTMLFSPVVPMVGAHFDRNLLSRVNQFLLLKVVFDWKAFLTSVEPLQVPLAPVGLVEDFAAAALEQLAVHAFPDKKIERNSSLRSLLFPQSATELPFGEKHS